MGVTCMNNNSLKSLDYELDHILKVHSERVSIYKDGEKDVLYSDLSVFIQNVINIFNAYNLSVGETVVIRSVKCEFTYAAMLACVKYGIIFCFVDPKTPQKRLHEILKLTEPRLILNGLGVEECASHIEQVYLAKIQYNNHETSEAIVDREIGPSAPAYIVFTSGSTGTPKGVTISRASLQLFISWAKHTYSLTCHDIHTHLNPIYFDNSIFDIFSTFFTGASLVPFTDEECRNPFHLADKIQKYKCNILFSVPSLLRFIINLRAAEGGQLSSLTKIIFGGEGYPISELSKLYDLTKQHATLYNVYGPSECTCICSTYRITLDDFNNRSGFPPIGKVTENFDYYILDECLQPVSDGDVGELYLGGPCVGLGYFNDVERTKEKFLTYQDRYNFQNKIYRTGDLFKYNETDGKLYFIGRKDFQIKKQGYRIELEEIEINATTHNRITDACCIYSEKTNKLTLVLEANNNVTLDEIKIHLTSLLPTYMLPDEIKLLARMVKNANGKTDRQGIKSLLNELETLT